jgi:hypothetical protein
MSRITPQPQPVQGERPAAVRLSETQSVSPAAKAEALLKPIEDGVEQEELE